MVEEMVQWLGKKSAKRETRESYAAKVIDKLFEQLEDVEQNFAALVHRLGGGSPEGAKQAAESFNALQGYYRRNSIWLPLRVSNQVSDFLARYRKPFNDFISMLESRGYQPGYTERWNEVWSAFEQEAPEIRQTLKSEFRAALGSWRAKLAILLEYLSVSRQGQKPPSSETSRP